MNNQLMAKAPGPDIHYANIMGDYKMDDIYSKRFPGPN